MSRRLTFCFRLLEQRQRFAIHLWRRLAFFLGGAFRFTDRHQEFGLLSRQFTASGSPASFPDLGEIFTNLARQCDSFGQHKGYRNRLTVGVSRVLRQQPTRDPLLNQ